VRQIGIEPGRQPDGDRQRRGRWAERPVAHPDPDGTVGDLEPRDPQFFNCGHVPLDLNLSGDLIEVLPSLGGSRGHPVDVDGLRRAAQLGDLLLQRHRLNQPLGALAG
jgi:hypothetical protein